jgi:hypothetical protein
MSTEKVIYYAATALLSIILLFSAGMYIFNHATIVNNFQSLGYPIYIIYPLAAAKILGLFAIWSNYSKTLKEWAYAGFFFNFILALSAHINAGDGGYLFAAMALVLLAFSYVFYKRTEE